LQTQINSAKQYAAGNLPGNTLIKALTNAPSEKEQSTTPKAQLNALTSLRFFACAAIVFLHSAWFFFDIEFMKNWQLDEGVAFFFVLSGFILTYVYPNLQKAEDIKHFLANRLGRMVPSHVFLLFITLAVLPCSCSTLGVFLANLFLVQSWIPRQEYYFGLNAVAWSICVEIFFSIAFVSLIKPWKIGWAGKLTLGIFLTIDACIGSHLFIASGGHGFLKFTPEYLLKINPLVRTSDFILGMITAKLWLRYNHLVKWNQWQMTCVELILATLIIFEVTQINDVLKNCFPILNNYPSVIYWLTHGGCSPIFALVIFVMATEKGLLSKVLANPVIVWLGEVSFSMYMVHFILIQSLNSYLPEFGRINWPITYSIYLATVIFVSYLNFNIIENPIRKWIKAIISANGKYRFSSSETFRFFRPKLGASAVTALLLVVMATASGAYVINSQSRFNYANLDLEKTIDFENYFRLEKVIMASASDGSKIKFHWRSLKNQTVNRLIEISCIDKDGKMLRQYDKKDMCPLKLKANEILDQTIYLPSDPEHRLNWSKLGLRLSIDANDENHRHQFRILAPQGGSVDWWATRVSLPLKPELL
jgi:peptidoglycan/LPS O-acetylase OafA/YrhL